MGRREQEEEKKVVHKKRGKEKQPFSESHTARCAPLRIEAVIPGKSCERTGICGGGKERKRRGEKSSLHKHTASQIRTPSLTT